MLSLVLGNSCISFIKWTVEFVLFFFALENKIEVVYYMSIC